MKIALLRALLCCAGLALLSWAVLPSAVTPATAAPRFAVTETSTAEPPTPTPIPSATLPPAPPSPPPPTATEIGGGPPPPPASPTLETAPTSPPEEPPPDDSDDDGPTATPSTAPGGPTATPSPVAGVVTPTVALPALSPTAGGAGGPLADPAITKSVSPAVAQVGQRVVYTISVTNLGTGSAAGVRVDDTLPSFVRPVEVTTTRGQASISGQSVQVLIGDLAPGETVTISVTATVVAPAPASNRNLATVSSDTPDGNPSNNQASIPLETDGPTSLPNTGDEGQGGASALILMLGLALLGAGIFLNGRPARQ